MTALLIILALVLVAFYVNDSWRTHERVRQIARRSCEQAGVQLLDGSVVRTRQSIRRRPGGLAWWRQYRFEFATDGASRHVGEISLDGRRLRQVTLDLPDDGRLVDGDGGAGHRGPER
ncbi:MULTISPECIES: DUF3301 domain-containing protein [unclassified Thioalkalivibrio]|uniref:DUF3301 domain-containing protein n=1 Tax=unclassified Thioalkalivibrio TaxID=2621013 RepID=UPI00035F3559|nr:MULTISPECIES: DUF3301 domain-containing protein [unclassified Thioalkalivibrio]